MLIAAIAAGVITLGLGVGLATFIAKIGMDISFRFGGVVFWMTYVFMIAIPAFLGAFCGAISVGEFVYRHTA